ncbi:hypothetical protein KKB3_00682, partial [Dehalococcoides mccartyi]
FIRKAINPMVSVSLVTNPQICRSDGEKHFCQTDCQPGWINGLATFNPFWLASKLRLNSSSPSSLKIYTTLKAYHLPAFKTIFGGVNAKDIFDITVLQLYYILIC